MKYIRTKDGIYDKVDETLMLASLPAQYELKKNGVHIGYEQCQKCQLADTIEELCDEFVMISEYRKPYVVRKGGYKGVFEGWQFCKEEKHKTTFFGAIWTDKGLIYVAKMNEKGELELL